MFKMSSSSSASVLLCICVPTHRLSALTQYVAAHTHPSHTREPNTTANILAHQIPFLSKNFTNVKVITENAIPFVCVRMTSFKRYPSVVSLQLHLANQCNVRRDANTMKKATQSNEILLKKSFFYHNLPA